MKESSVTYNNCFNHFSRNNDRADAASFRPLEPDPGCFVRDTVAATAFLFLSCDKAEDD